MKNIGIAAWLIGLVSFGFVSCSSNSDTVWRDDNLRFFDSLAKHSDIQTLGDSINGYPGIYYKVLTPGTGTIPVVGNVVKVAYAGWLWNDTVKYNSPLALKNAFDYNMSGLQVKVGTGVIEGWSLVLQRMPVGSKWRVYIPYNMAYGSSGSSSIPAYSTLIFDMTLLEISSDN
ncbi:MAG TPA: FKBP-type peptidyl-prolyl cis-trans isomerase [Bacteroidales bacterium]|nr:FKBP-type peptidyl-prolyl cis-trans isomerase [Bacteroidales bacterium]